MIRLTIVIVILLILYWLLGKTRSHKCHQLGNCYLKCIWCKTWGFFALYETKDRTYRMCKWCGKVQDKGKEIIQCYMEICPKCVPSYKELEKEYSPEEHNLEKKRRIGDPKKLKRPFGSWTMRPGHPCPICETKMVAFKPKYDWYKEQKEELYKFHDYK